MALAACFTHEVNTADRYCEQLKRVDMERKYRPFWAVLFAVRFSGDAIRVDYAKTLDKVYMERVKGRSPRMVWNDGAVLHLTNLSGLFVVEPEAFIQEWRGILESAKAPSADDGTSDCVGRALLALFDAVHIHTLEPDAMGIKWTHSVIIIPTDRQARFAKHRLKPL